MEVKELKFFLNFGSFTYVFNMEYIPFMYLLAVD